MYTVCPVHLLDILIQFWVFFSVWHHGHVSRFIKSVAEHNSEMPKFPLSSGKVEAPVCAVEIFFLEMLICQANVFIQNIANLKLAMTPIANFQEEAICIYSFKSIFSPSNLHRHTLSLRFLLHSDGCRFPLDGVWSTHSWSINKGFFLAAHKVKAAACSLAPRSQLPELPITASIQSSFGKWLHLKLI